MTICLVYWHLTFLQPGVTRLFSLYFFDFVLIVVYCKVRFIIAIDFIFVFEHMNICLVGVTDSIWFIHNIQSGLLKRICHFLYLFLVHHEFVRLMWFKVHMISSHRLWKICSPFWTNSFWYQISLLHHFEIQVFLTATLRWSHHLFLCRDEICFTVFPEIKNWFSSTTLFFDRWDLRQYAIFIKSF